MTNDSTKLFGRREILKDGAAVTGLALFGFGNSIFAADAAGEEWIPFINAPRARPGQLDWEGLDSWITPQEQVFWVAHYGIPEMPAEKDYRLELSGLVENPKQFTLDEIKALPRQDHLMTLECSGNGAGPGFMGAIYNAKFTGTPLATFLKAAGIKPGAKEIVFFGHDNKVEKMPYRKKEYVWPAHFARSMSVGDALSSNALLVYEANGKPLTKNNGSPLRLIRPGYYGIANVKWLKSIEVWDRQYMGKYMAREYITLRGERRGDQIFYKETSVGKMNIKSIIARVTRKKNANGKDSIMVYGAVWSHDATKIKAVEVRIDDGDWLSATLDEKPRSQNSWVFFAYECKDLKPGKHVFVSRGIETNGHIQPSKDDDEIALKQSHREAYEQYPREIEI